MSTGVAKTTDRLHELETTIEKSAEAVWDMAHALAEIKRDKLYHPDKGGEYRTWKAYCDERWGITSDWANQMIAATDVVAQIKNTGPAQRLGLPETVSAAADLAKVPEDDRVEVWRKATESADQRGAHTPTKGDVRKAASEHREAKAPPPPPPDPSRKAYDAARRVRDTAGSFRSAVTDLMDHIDDLDPDDASSAAYSIVETVHTVISTLQQHGHLKESVGRAVMEGSDVAA